MPTTIYPGFKANEPTAAGRAIVTAADAAAQRSLLNVPALPDPEPASGTYAAFDGAGGLIAASDPAVVWGSITGTLANQTDLQSALDAKVAKAGDTMTGTLELQKQSGQTADLLKATDGATDLFRIEADGSLFNSGNKFFVEVSNSASGNNPFKIYDKDLNITWDEIHSSQVRKIGARFFHLQHWSGTGSGWVEIWPAASPTHTVISFIGWGGQKSFVGINTSGDSGFNPWVCGSFTKDDTNFYIEDGVRITGGQTPVGNCMTIKRGGTLRMAKGYEFLSSTADPTTTDIPASVATLWKNTTTGDLKLWANDGGAVAPVGLYEVSWGDIVGTLANQADLQSALDAKVAKAGDTMTGGLHISATGGDLFKVTDSGLGADVLRVSVSGSYTNIHGQGSGYIQVGSSQYNFPNNGGNVVFGSGSSGMSFNTWSGCLIRHSAPQVRLIDNSSSGKGYKFRIASPSGDAIFTSFDNYDQSNVVDRIAFTNNGLVGIGTTSPTVPLHVVTNATDLLTLDSTSATNANRLTMTNPYGTVKLEQIGAQFRVSDSAGAAAFTVDVSTGRMGIGAPPSGNDLDIWGGRVLGLRGGNATVKSEEGMLTLRAGSSQELVMTGSQWRFNGFDAGALVNVRTDITTRPTVIIRELASQTADVWCVQNDTGATKYDQLQPGGNRTFRCTQFSVQDYQSAGGLYQITTNNADHVYGRLVSYTTETRVVGFGFDDAANASYWRFGRNTNQTDFFIEPGVIGSGMLAGSCLRLSTTGKLTLAQGLAYRSGTADPTVSDIESGAATVWKNTTAGTLKLVANDGGVIKSVTLT